MRWSHGALMAAAGAVIAFEALPYRPVIVKGVSMEPTYKNGSLVIGTRHIGVLHRGDVVVVRVDGRPIIKRIAFLPGDSYTQMKVAYSWVNAASSESLKAIRKRGWPERTFTIPDGYLYVVGDNNVRSDDSRMFGPVPMSDVQYRVLNAKPAENGPCFAVDGPGKPGYQPPNCTQL